LFCLKGGCPILDDGGFDDDWDDWDDWDGGDSVVEAWSVDDTDGII
jgi:hypothetical protein